MNDIYLAIDKNEYDVRVIMPYYTCIPDKYRKDFKYVSHFYMDYGMRIVGVHVGIMEYEYNGIKCFGATGYKLTDEQEARIESMVLDDGDDTVNCDDTETVKIYKEKIQELIKNYQCEKEKEVKNDKNRNIWWKF